MKKPEVTTEMIELMRNLRDLTIQCTEEVYENEQTKSILDCCDNLIDALDNYFED